MLSWCYDVLNTVPYLRALGDYGTGKSRFEDIIGGLCYKPMFTNGAITPAVIYRVLRSGLEPSSLMRAILRSRTNIMKLLKY